MRKRKNNKFKFKTIYKIFYIILTLLFIGFLKIINIIPTLYFIIILFVTLLISFLILLLMKKKKKIGYILSVILIIIYSIITYYLGITMNFFKEKIHYSEETYLVLVLKENNYKNLNDIENKNIGYVNNELHDINEALNKLDKKININKKEYENTEKLFNDLDTKIIESLLIDENYYNIKKEEESTDKYKILYKIKIRKIVNEKNKNVDITNKPFTIYISGIDVYGDIETVSRSDVNILMTINPKTKQVLLTSIPRDYYVTLHNTTGYKDKLTHAGNYGINMSIDTIEDLLGIDINYYIRVNFSTLENMIDAIDGVDVYSEYQFVSYIDSYQFYKGYNHMNGKQALAFSRERKSLPGGDNDRGKNQEAVIEAIIRKATSKSIIYNYPKILSKTKNTFQTNLKDTDITKMIKKELSNIGGWNITSTNLEGTGSMDYTYSYSSQKLYVTIPNEESIVKAKELINKVINGETLESTYQKNIGNINNPTKYIQKETHKKEEPKKEVQKEEKQTENETEKEITKEEQKEPLDDILPNDEEQKNNETNNTDNNNEEKNPVQDLLPEEESNE